MDENARKRKREEQGELSEVDSTSREAPGEGLKQPEKKKKRKKQQLSEGDEDAAKQAKSQDDAAIAKEKAEKRREKRQARQEKAKQDKVKQKQKQKRRAKKGKESNGAQDEVNKDGNQSEEDSDEADNVEAADIDITGIDNVQKPEAALKSGSTTPSKAPSPSFDPPQDPSGTSSVSSLATQNAAPAEQPAKKPKLEIKIGQEELRARLQKRVAELRAARKADNEDGTPARTRSELIDMRRKKAEEKKKNKKALRQQAKEEERRQKEIALARGSPLLSPSGMSPAGLHGQSPLSDPANNFSFGRVAFENGQFMNSSLDSVLEHGKNKGPQDPYTALQAAEKKTARVNRLDAGKRADIEEKDMWLNARKRAQGERPRDDTSLLKKTLKRKDKQKKKSEKDWNDRIAGVAQGQAARQKKREENMAKRKEAKGSKGKGGKKAGGATKSKKKARPGFEGSFKAGR